MPKNPLLGQLVVDLHVTLGERYRSPPEEDPITGCKRPRQDIPQSIYDTILSKLEDALRNPDWPKSDGPQCQQLKLSDQAKVAALSGTKRSRSVAARSGTFFEEPAGKRSGPT
jgi:hypothetical protein